MLEKVTGTVLRREGQRPHDALAGRDQEGRPRRLSRANDAADCVIRTRPRHFREDRRREGEPVRRGAPGTVGVEGDPELIVQFQRIFRAEQSQATISSRSSTATPSSSATHAETSRRRSPIRPRLFSFDTRFLSKWILTVDGERLNPLSVDDLQYFSRASSLVPRTGTVYVDAKLSVIRTRSVGDGFHEELTISTTTRSPSI